MGEDIWERLRSPFTPWEIALLSSGDDKVDLGQTVFRVLISATTPKHSDVAHKFNQFTHGHEAPLDRFLRVSSGQLLLAYPPGSLPVEEMAWIDHRAWVDGYTSSLTIAQTAREASEACSVTARTTHTGVGPADDTIEGTNHTFRTCLQLLHSAAT
jgi:hypothetical protein